MSSKRPITSTEGRPDTKVGRTYVGVDAGECPIATVAVEGTTAGDAVAVDDEGTIRGAWRHLWQTTQLLAETPGVSERAEAAVLASDWRRLRSSLKDLVQQTVDLATNYPNPTLAIEDLGRDARPAWVYRHNGEIGTWLLPAYLAMLKDEAAARGVDVVAVDPAGTSQRCHNCGERGGLASSRFQCTNNGCSVNWVDRDANAALTIAYRGRRQEELNRMRVHR